MSACPFQVFPMYSLPLSTPGFMLVFPKHGNTLESRVEIFASTETLVSSQTIRIRTVGRQPGAENHCSRVSLTPLGSYYHLASAGIITGTIATARVPLHCAPPWLRQLLWLVFAPWDCAQCIFWSVAPRSLLVSAHLASQGNLVQPSNHISTEKGTITSWGYGLIMVSLENNPSLFL